MGIEITANASGRPSETAQGVIVKLVDREMALAVGSLFGDPLEFTFPLDFTLHEAYGIVKPEMQAVADYRQVSASRSVLALPNARLCAAGPGACVGRLVKHT